MNKIIGYLIISLIYSIYTDRVERINKCNTPFIGSLIVGLLWPVSVPVQLVNMEFNNKFVTWCN